MKHFFVFLGISVLLGVITYFIVTPESDDFSVPAQRTAVQCAGCMGKWDGKGKFIDMIWF